MRNSLFIASGLLTILALGAQAHAEESIYQPYYSCMAQCTESAHICDDNIPSKGPDLAERGEACARENATCVQECRYLPMPGGDGVAPPPENPQQEQSVSQADRQAE